MFATYLSTLPCEISEITILLCTITSESSLELQYNCPVQLSMQSMLKYYRTGTKHGLDWTGQLDWTVGLDSWTGQLDWTVGLDSWTGQLDWTIGLEFFSIKYMQFDVFEENEMIIFKLLCFFL